MLGPTPELLVKLGLFAADLVMTRAKIARCRREHPAVSLDTWRDLPRLLADPLAAFPSERNDGSLVIVLVVTDSSGDPIIVPVAPDQSTARNVVLSVYGKEAGISWVHAQIALHAQSNGPLYKRSGFAASLPQPGFTEVIPSSHGPIPSDGTTKPMRQMLSVGRKVKDADQ